MFAAPRRYSRSHVRSRATAPAQQQRAQPHDLMTMETSGYLDRLGFEIPDASPDQIFREPDSVRRAYEGSKQR